MGTDIHLYVEYKDKRGQWHIDDRLKCERCNGMGREPIYDIEKFEYNDDECYECCGDAYIKHDRGGRSYWLFGVLADVSNTHEVKPISQPKGIPQDASIEYIKIANYASDYHSHSYLALKELKEYDGVGCFSKEHGWEYLRGYLPSYLEELADTHGGDENVRIVFFFDN